MNLTINEMFDVDKLSLSGLSLNDGKYYKNTTKIIGMTSVSFDSDGTPTPSPS